jgi:hypothetical protein
MDIKGATIWVVFSHYGEPSSESLNDVFDSFDAVEKAYPVKWVPSEDRIESYTFDDDKTGKGMYTYNTVVK